MLVQLKHRQSNPFTQIKYHPETLRLAESKNKILITQVHSQWKFHYLLIVFKIKKT